MTGGKIEPVPSDFPPEEPRFVKLDDALVGQNMTDREYLDAFEAEADRKLDTGVGSLAALSTLERLFVLRRSFQWEVNNGGLHTFFYNSSGDYAAETLQVLRTIGAAEAAQLVSEAVALFGETGPSPDVIERRQQMKQFSTSDTSRLDKLTDNYFRLEHNGLATADLLDEYLLARRQGSG